jgi:hypothetical protein
MRVLQHCLQELSQIPLVCEILIPAVGLHRRSQNCTVISLSALRGGIGTRSKNKVCCIQTKLQLSLKVKLLISNRNSSFTSVNTALEETLVLRFGTDLRHLLVTWSTWAFHNYCCRVQLELFGQGCKTWLMTYVLILLTKQSKQDMTYHFMWLFDSKLHETFLVITIDRTWCETCERSDINTHLHYQAWASNIHTLKHK